MTGRLRALTKLFAGSVLGAGVALVSIEHQRLPKGAELKHVVETPQIIVNAKDIASKEKFITSANCMCGRDVALSSLPEFAVPMLMRSEDRRFGQHRGLDYLRLARAAISLPLALLGIDRSIQGASTVHQQLAGHAVTGRQRRGPGAFFRKVREAIIAREIAKAMTPEQVLTAYFEKMPFGLDDSGRALNGIHDAATFHFGREDASKLDAVEFGFLIVSLRSSFDYDPTRHRDAAKESVNTLLKGMVERNLLKASILHTLDRPRPRGADEHYAADMRWYMDASYDEVRAVTPQNAIGTLRISVTLDPSRQRHLEAAVVDGVRRAAQHRADAAAAVTIDDEGAVIAIVGGPDFATNQFNLASRGGRPTGSAFKPFTYACAFEAGRGITPETRVLDAPVHVGDWSPGNSTGKYIGWTTIRHAFAMSINSVAVSLGVRLGIDCVIALAKRMGVEAAYGDSPTVLLGTTPISPMTLAVGYLPFVKNGLRSNAYFVSRVIGYGGVVLYRREKIAPVRVLRQTTVRNMKVLLGEVVWTGTGKQAGSANGSWGGKTGTNGRLDAWYVGLESDTVTSVWVGRLDHKEMHKTALGGSLAAPIFRDYTSGVEKESKLGKRRALPLLGPNRSVPQVKKTGV